MATHTLLHDAVLRAANLQNQADLPPAPRHLASSHHNDDSVLTRVHSPVTSPPNQSPRSVSPIPSSPSKSNSSRNQSRLGLRQKREAASRAKQNSLDPLRRFPADVNVRIFTIVGLGRDGCGGHLDGSSFSAVKDLLNCGLVSQKWRSSAVINYVWYKLFNQTTYSSSIQDEFQPPTWTRKDSRTNWCDRYKELNEVKPPPSRPVDEEDDRREPTRNELNRAQWESENRDPQSSVMSKNEARAFYKDLGGRKLKDKTGKGWGADRTGWDDRDIYN